MKQNKKHLIQIAVQILVILAIGSGSIWVASLFSKDDKKEGGIETKKVVECPLDTISYEETKTKKNLKLLENKISYGINGSFAGHDYNVLIKRSGLQSKIACGYLFYRVSVGEKPIEQASEGLYMIPTSSKQFGGHIMADSEYIINVAENNGKTEVLIPLNAVYHDGTQRINIKKSDWASLLNVSDQISFNLALNTIRQNGRIDSVEIAYKCWNPQTGEETNDCLLEVEK